MVAEVINISIKRDENRLRALDKQHDKYLGQFVALVLHGTGEKAIRDMGKLNILMDAIQTETATIEERVWCEVLASDLHMLEETNPS